MSRFERTRVAHPGGSGGGRVRGLLATPARVAVDLTPQAVDQIALRVVALLRRTGSGASAPRTPTWVTAKELAAHLKLNPAWVYENAEKLGAIRTGDGPKARMRFDLETATKALQGEKPAAPAEPPRGAGQRVGVRPSAPPRETSLLGVRRREARPERAFRPGVRAKIFSRPWR